MLNFPPTGRAGRKLQAKCYPNHQHDSLRLGANMHTSFSSKQHLWHPKTRLSTVALPLDSKDFSNRFITNTRMRTSVWLILDSITESDSWEVRAQLLTFVLLVTSLMNPWAEYLLLPGCEKHSSRATGQDICYVLLYC
jgi:hypothetical protein